MKIFLHRGLALAFSVVSVVLSGFAVPDCHYTQGDCQTSFVTVVEYGETRTRWIHSCDGGEPISGYAPGPTSNYC